MKVKSILSILLCLTVVLAFLPIGASAANGIYISNITVTGLVEPVVGATQTSAGVSVPANAGYSIYWSGTGWFWDYDEGGSDNYWFSGKFEAGKTYKFDIDFTIAGGYYVDSNTTATINGKTATFSHSSLSTHAYLRFTMPGENYTVTFNKNGGTGTMASQSILENNRITLPECGFTAPAGKEFKAWEIGGVEYLPGDRLKITGNLTAKAIWATIETFTVTFNMCGHGTAIPAQTGISRNGLATRPATPSAANYRFKDWYTDSSYTTAFDFSTDRIGQNLTLYAKWLEYLPSIEVYGIIEPMEGQSPTKSSIFLPSDAKYRIYQNGSGWFWDHDEGGSDNYWYSSNFIAGKTYKLDISFYLTDGYYVDRNTTATFNGKPATFDPGNYYSSAYLRYVAKDAPIAVESGWYLDCNGCLNIIDAVSVDDSTGEAPWQEYKSQITSIVTAPGSSIDNCSEVFSECPHLVTADLSNLDTSSVTNMVGMFYNCPVLTTVDLSKLDTSNVATMFGMFMSCPSLTDVNFSGFDTSKVETMSRMFYGCSSLTSLDLSFFDASVLSTMSQMFYNCTSLKQLNITNLYAADGSSMLTGCAALSEISTNHDELYRIAKQLIDISSVWYNRANGTSYSTTAEIRAITGNVTLTTSLCSDGDINKDGMINIVDLALLKQALLNKTTNALYDINGNGVADVRDLVCLKKILASL